MSYIQLPSGPGEGSWRGPVTEGIPYKVILMEIADQ
jgi:hypothetical protein